ncbi:AI-2E family transporter [Citricoccus sp. SGAir0253]|uniref:AI-2E family transporter n=1 Tax=Citricoccus sp. SGAir0253 TaxID=2567881 RepID=UPI0010CD2B5B|nr:AI-2E family transporter [Citricoccus sp. SGAir0253]QCU78406.1 AI-2E family transporter [Citricoccus sp. SGAir0253]
MQDHDSLRPGPGPAPEAHPAGPAAPGEPVAGSPDAGPAGTPGTGPHGTTVPAGPAGAPDPAAASGAAGSPRRPGHPGTARASGLVGRLLAGHRLPGARPRPRFELRPESEQGAEGEAAPAVDRQRLVSWAHPVQTGFLLTVGVGLALLLYGILSANTQLLVWIGAALFIALGLDPLVRRIEGWGAPRGVGVAAAVLLLAALLTAFFSLLIPTVVEQTTTFIGDLPRMVSDFLESQFLHDLDARFGIRELAATEMEKFVGNSANVTAIFGGLFGVGSAIVNTGFSVLIVLVLTLYFLVSLPAMKYWAYRLAPRSRRHRVEYLGEEITSSVGLYVIGQSLVAVLNGFVAFVAISIAGIPFGALLAFFAGLMAFIPLVGALTGGVIITLIALAGGWQQAVVFAAIYFIYLQVEAYFVSPRVMSKAVAVPGSVAVIAVIAGAALLGVLGALMAIPLAAAVMLVVKEVLIPRQDRL